MEDLLNIYIYIYIYIYTQIISQKILIQVIWGWIKSAFVTSILGKADV